MATSYVLNGSYKWISYILILPLMFPNCLAFLTNFARPTYYCYQKSCRFKNVIISRLCCVHFTARADAAEGKLIWWTFQLVPGRSLTNALKSSRLPCLCTTIACENDAGEGAGQFHHLSTSPTAKFFMTVLHMTLSCRIVSSWSNFISSGR